MTRHAFLFTALAIAACTEPPDAPELALETAAISGFVRTAPDAQGRPRFAADGRTFRFIGGNMTELPWLDGAAQDAELAWAKASGFEVVRVWGVDEAENADQLAVRLRATLDRAAAHGLRVTIALTHNYRQPNWVKQQNTIHAVPKDARKNDFITNNDNGFYTRACGPGLLCLDDNWLDWGYNGYYRQYALRLVQLLADHPAVFSWDIANEVTGSSTASWIVGRLTAFYVDMAAAIKATDRNHLVTTGMISSSWAGMTDAHRDQVYGSANIDYLTVHEYDGADGNRFNLSAQDDEVWRANARYHKPVVVEEVGVAGGDPASRIAAYYERRFHPADRNFEATGILYWGVASLGRNEITDHTWSPQALGLYDWFQQFWRGWGQTLAAESGAPTQRCRALGVNASLGRDQSVASCDGRYVLVYQGDANLVLYPAAGGPAVWSSCTNGTPGATVMQSDGNLVVYPASGPALWNTPTWGNTNAQLYFEAGGLVMRAANDAVIWSSAGRTCR